MSYYTIVTEFIEGRRPKREDEDDFKRCLESLKKLHELDIIHIIHGDARPPTDRRKVCILDFRFSFKVEMAEKQEGVKRDFKKMKSTDGFNINIF